MKLVHRGKVREVYSFEGGFPTDSDFTYRSGQYYVEDRAVMSIKRDDLVGLLFDDEDLGKIVKASEVSNEEFDKTINKMFRGWSK